MLDSITKSKRPIYWFHASGDGSHHPFRDYLLHLASHRPNFTRRVWYANPLPGAEPDPDPFDNLSPYHFKGIMDLSKVDNSMVAPHPESLYFMCGPPAWMSLIRNT
eukprot:CAMPEP_0174267208 /NCGR_PEP_ID=MMETSP0439-20130205/32826_1 /TAXON_ID=0 /ORGANISM="Stereomyxa ramosa, Strain Chinc5" /LENGTH=105 /DNA_ID=CAMNT_0015354575 /DNA_START=201 /DNA_END=514 /DNA_ORIENTATION=-